MYYVKVRKIRKTCRVKRTREKRTNFNVEINLESVWVHSRILRAETPFRNKIGPKMPKISFGLNIAPVIS